MTRSSIDSQVGSYRPTCEQLARPLVGRNGADVDDLVQEGLIEVWLRLKNGDLVDEKQIEGRMKRYVRWLGRTAPTEYEDAMSFEDASDAAQQV